MCDKDRTEPGPGLGDARVPFSGGRNYGITEGMEMAKAVPIRERLIKEAMSQQERTRRMLTFAERLTPEMEEMIEVLKEGIRLGVISFDGSLTRY